MIGDVLTRWRRWRRERPAVGNLVDIVLVIAVCLSVWQVVLPWSEHRDECRRLYGRLEETWHNGPDPTADGGDDYWYALESFNAEGCKSDALSQEKPWWLE